VRGEKEERGNWAGKLGWFTGGGDVYDGPLEESKTVKKPRGKPWGG